MIPEVSSKACSRCGCGIGLAHQGHSTDHPGICCACFVQNSDPVNPAHYQGDYVMRVIEDFNLDFLRGTVVKYLLRAGNKPGDSSLQDLRKAKWYLDRLIAKAEGRS